jgi:hypothetical protein
LQAGALPSKLVMFERRLALVSLEDIYEFCLVADDAQPPISTDNWEVLRYRILHLQPARSATLEGTPPRSIRIKGFGGTEVASGLLAGLERLAMTRLHVETAD